MQLINTTTPLTMTSREIAELLRESPEQAPRHDNVKVTMIRLAERGVITFTATQEPTPGGGKPRTVFHVNKRDSYVVVAQLSPEFTARLVDRWQELEAQVTPMVPAIPTTLVGALRLALAQAEELEAKTLQIEAMKPAATVGAMVAMHFRCGLAWLHPLKSGRLLKTRGDSLKAFQRLANYGER